MNTVETGVFFDANGDTLPEVISTKGTIFSNRTVIVTADDRIVEAGTTWCSPEIMWPDVETLLESVKRCRERKAAKA